jgi:arylsulfatase A-like enzyme
MPGDTPNIVIIMTDQQRADLCAREGFALDTTPFLDSLAAQGVWFDRAYTSQPACVPARESMLTGRWPSATRVRTNYNIADTVYSKDIFQVMRERGYATAMCGKNHSHLRPEDVDHWLSGGHLGLYTEDITEQEVEFNEFLNATHFHMVIEPTPFPVECQIPYRVVRDAQKWIMSCEEQPFFLWLSFPEPHNPFQAPEPYYSMFPPDELPPTVADVSDLPSKGLNYEWCRRRFEGAFPDFAQTLARARSNYMGMLRLIDDQVKRFVEFLDDQHLRDDTIIVFLSDHGDFVGEYGLMRKGPELPDVLTRIPMLVVGPGVAQHNGPHPAHVSIVDLMPTLCEAAGCVRPDGVQGRSLWPLLTGADYPIEEFQSVYAEHGYGGLHYTQRTLPPSLPDGERSGFDCLNSVTQSGTTRMLRKGRWKLAMDMQGHGQLYDLDNDPSELSNLYDTPEVCEIQNEMVAELLAWTLRASDPLPLPVQKDVEHPMQYEMCTDPHNYWSPHRH